MGSSSVEASCEAPEVFELVEAAFDPVAVFVEVGRIGTLRDVIDGMTASMPALAMNWRRWLLS